MMFPSRWERALATALFIVLALGILTIWVPARWPLAILQASVFGSSAALALRALARGDASAFNPCFVALCVPPLWGFVQLQFGWTVYRFATWEALLTWSGHLSVFWLATHLFRYRALRLRFRASLMWFGFAVAAASTLFYFATPGKIFGLFPVEYRAVGPFLNRDHYSTFVELVLPLALWEALSHPRRLWWGSLIAGVLYASVIAGASRMGSILVTLELLLMLFVQMRPRLRERGLFRTALAWIALFVIAFTAVVGWQVLWQRFAEPDPFAGRRELLQASMVMVQERPLTGFGLGNWPTAYRAYAVTDFGLSLLANHAHNDWVEWTAEGGIPLLAAMASLALMSLYYALRAPWGLGVPSAFVHCAVDFPFQRPALAAIVFALLGAMVASRQANRAKPWPGNEPTVGRELSRHLPERRT